MFEINKVLRSLKPNYSELEGQVPNIFKIIIKTKLPVILVSSTVGISFDISKAFGSLAQGSSNLNDMFKFNINMIYTYLIRILLI